MEQTKQSTEGRWNIIITTDKLYNAQVKSEYILASFYKIATPVNIQNNTGHK